MSGPEPVCRNCGAKPSDYTEQADRIATLERVLAEARAERAMFCALVESLTSERDEARRQLGEVVEVQEDLAGKLFDAVQERDAYRDGKRLSAWEHAPERSWGHGKTVEEWSRGGRTFVMVSWIRKDGVGEAWALCQGLSRAFPCADEARAAVDAHLIAAGWWLEGGPHGAGEAK